MMFEPDEADWKGLARILRTIDRDRGFHQGYKLECFSEDEAAWLKNQVVSARPRLRGRVFTSWLTFRGAA